MVYSTSTLFFSLQLAKMHILSWFEAKLEVQVHQQLRVFQ